MPNDPILINGEWLLAPENEPRAREALMALSASEDVQRAQREAADMAGSFWPEEGSWLNHVRPYTVEDGILYIPVNGVLLHRFPYAFGGYATGYAYLREALRRGLDDSGVKGIVFHTNSPGGMVSGCFDLVDEIYAARGTKPMWTITDEHAYSAAYAIASATDKIVVARTGGVGSIGVLATHVSYAKMLENEGIQYTFVAQGDFKTDERPELPLSDHARKRMDDRGKYQYSLFVSAVARNRGMDEQAVIATQADAFTAPESVENGLADEIGPFDDAVAAFADHLINPEEGDDTMSKEDNTAVDQAAHEAALAAARQEGFEAGKAEGLEEGASAGSVAERERIASILGSEEAKARPVAADKIAHTTDMSVEKAVALLGTLPEEAKAPEADDEAGGKAFDDAMTGGNPNLGHEDTGAGSGEETQADRVRATVGKVGLRGFRAPKAK